MARETTRLKRTANPGYDRRIPHDARAMNPLVFCLGLVISLPCHTAATAAAASVPAVYVLGDSLADVGNNNYIPTVIKADFPHNGVDYSGKKATGRFGNGRNFPDFIAEHLGIASSPPYLSICDIATYRNGVNFASGGAGVLQSTNMNLCISFDKQIEYYSGVHASLVKQLGYPNASEHLARSIFAVTIGSNDIIDYVRLTGVVTRVTNPTHDKFIGSLLRSLKDQINRLYCQGARKFLFAGIGPVGCCPMLRAQSLTKDCNDEANYLSVEYNKAVLSLLQDMSAQYSDMSYSFFNVFDALDKYIQQPAAHGFTEVKAACCGIGDALNVFVSCTPVSSLCENRTSHIFWDFAHPTEIAVQKLSAVALDGSAPFVYPMNVKKLIAI